MLPAADRTVSETRKLVATLRAVLPPLLKTVDERDRLTRSDKITLSFNLGKLVNM